MKLSLGNKKWVFARPSQEEVNRLAQELKVSPLITTLMVNRNISSPQEGATFINADLEGLHDPFLMLGMDRAVDRIVEAIEKGEKITIFGDYDVDGITSTALLYHFFKELDTPFDHYLPERMVEGYGVNENALQEIKNRGSSLVITADCGVTATKQVEFANSIGLEVIITDHHQVPADGLPNALAMLNPHQPDCPYPFKFLCGVGIVFKLAVAIRRRLRDKGREEHTLPNLKQHLDLLTLGTIADMAPLNGENHVLTAHGMEALRHTTKPGLVALKEVAGIDGTVDSSSIGFGLAPRLNAAGRLGRADSGLDLLVSSDIEAAKAMAEGLNQLNEERKKTQQEAQEVAEYIIEREIDLDENKVLVIASEDFHQGVIGIVAAKLADKFNRPTFLIAINEEGMGKGSARSIPTFNLYKALTQCGDYLVQYGGHAFAAGLNIEASRIDDFRRAMNENAEAFLNEETMVSELHIDAALSIREIDFELYREIQQLAPFGQVNTVPVFCSKNIQVRGKREIGKEKNHVRFKAVQGGDAIDVVGFRMARMFRELEDGMPVDIVYELQPNHWNGRNKLELKLLDLRPSGEDLD